MKIQQHFGKNITIIHDSLKQISGLYYIETQSQQSFLQILNFRYLNTPF